MSLGHNDNSSEKQDRQPYSERSVFVPIFQEFFVIFSCLKVLQNRKRVLLRIYTVNQDRVNNCIEYRFHTDVSY